MSEGFRHRSRYASVRVISEGLPFNCPIEADPARLKLTIFPLIVPIEPPEPVRTEPVLVFKDSFSPTSAAAASSVPCNSAAPNSPRLSAPGLAFPVLELAFLPRAYRNDAAREDDSSTGEK
jgi:hypothetical protein